MGNETVLITHTAENVGGIIPAITGGMAAIGTQFMTNPILQVALGILIVGIGFRFVKSALHSAVHE